jgi:HAD superfamily hydrolase (TIGR01490 family)
MGGIVIFDIGKTLVRCTHKDVVNFLYKKRKASLFFLLKISLFFLLYKISLIRDKNVDSLTRKSFCILKGWDIQKVNRLSKECFEQIIKPRIIPESYEIIQAHIKKGRKVILISALLGEVIEFLKEYLGLEFAIYPKLEIKNKKYTGEIIGLVPYGANKVKLVQELLEKNNLTCDEKWGYADRFSDIPLLTLVKYPTVINPDKKMRKFAKTRKWKICDF